MSTPTPEPWDQRSWFQATPGDEPACVAGWEAMRTIDPQTGREQTVTTLDRFWRWRHRKHGGITSVSPPNDTHYRGWLCQCGKLR